MGKCKYVKVCELYNELSPTCNSNSGMYYGEGRPAGCYRKLEEENNGK